MRHAISAAFILASLPWLFIGLIVAWAFGEDDGSIEAQKDGEE